MSAMFNEDYSSPKWVKVTQSQRSTGTDTSVPLNVFLVRYGNKITLGLILSMQS